MSSLFWASYAAMWLMIALLAILVTLLYRQFGLMLMPGGQRVGYGGLDIGTRAPAVLLHFDGDRERAYDWTPLSVGLRVSATFALFAMPACPLCAKLLEDHDALAEAARRHSPIQFLWVQGVLEAGNPLPSTSNWVSARSHDSAAHEAMEVPGSPFAYLVSGDGHILAKGLVNEASDIDGLIAAARTDGVTLDLSHHSGQNVLEPSLEVRP